MILAIGNDHRGYNTKRNIVRIVEEWDCQFIDKGCFSEDSVDYPVFARQVCGSVISGESDRGILICGTGIGMSMVANRFPGIRAALCYDIHTAKMSRQHNDANVICLPGDQDTMDLALILNTWLNEEFEGGRHKKRVLGIDGVY